MKNFAINNLLIYSALYLIRIIHNSLFGCRKVTAILWFRINKIGKTVDFNPQFVGIVNILICGLLYEKYGGSDFLLDKVQQVSRLRQIK